MYALFINSIMAFDSIKCDLLLEIQEKIGIPPPLFIISKNYMPTAKYKY